MSCIDIDFEFAYTHTIKAIDVSNNRTRWGARIVLQKIKTYITSLSFKLKLERTCVELWKPGLQ